jgi:hypothetical protein
MRQRILLMLALVVGAGVLTVVSGCGSGLAPSVSPTPKTGRPIHLPFDTSETPIPTPTPEPTPEPGRSAPTPPPPSGPIKTPDR